MLALYHCVCLQIYHYRCIHLILMYCVNAFCRLIITHISLCWNMCHCLLHALHCYWRCLQHLGTCMCLLMLMQSVDNIACLCTYASIHAHTWDCCLMLMNDVDKTLHRCQCTCMALLVNAIPWYLRCLQHLGTCDCLMILMHVVDNGENMWMCVKLH